MALATNAEILVSQFFTWVSILGPSPRPLPVAISASSMAGNMALA